MAFWIVVGTLVVMGVWSIATGTYFAFREDVLTRLIGRQADLQFAYEDRIAELRSQVDRVTSRQLLDQEQFEKKLSALIQRQTVLESRTSALTSDVVTTGSIKPARVPPPEAQKPVKASPISDTVIFVAPPDREARLQSRELPASSTRLAERGAPAASTAPDARGAIARQSRAQADRGPDRHGRADGQQGAAHPRRTRRSRRRDRATPANAATGGPFVPMKAPQSGASAFERQLYRINFARAQVDQYNRTLVAVPVRKPVFGEIDMSSPFGMRMDPFMKGPAIHTGIDMRGDTGDPVRVTATAP